MGTDFFQTLSVLQCPIIMGSDFTETQPLEVIFRSNREYHSCVTALVEANLMAFHEGPGHVKGHPGEDRKSLVIFHVIDVYWWSRSDIPSRSNGWPESTKMSFYD